MKIYVKLRRKQQNYHDLKNRVNYQELQENR